MKFYNDGGENCYINPARVNFVTIEQSEGLFIVMFNFDNSSRRDIIYPSYADAKKEVERFLSFCED